MPPTGEPAGSRSWQDIVISYGASKDNRERLKALDPLETRIIGQYVKTASKMELAKSWPAMYFR